MICEWHDSSPASLLRRYEILYMRDSGRVATSVDQHNAIAAALERGRQDEALRALERNWTATFAQLAPWLQRLTSLDSDP